jgi:hypothetical protein
VRFWRLVCVYVAISGCGRYAFDPDGLVAAYRMDDLGPTGDRLIDNLGGHDGVCVPPACPAVVAGKFGNGLEFDDADDIVIAASPDLEMTTGFTVAAWVRIDALPSHLSHIAVKPLGTGDLDTWALTIMDDGTIAFYDDGTTIPHGLHEATVISLSTWHHIAARWNGTMQQIVLDGFVVVGEAYSGIGWDGSAVHIGTDIVGGVPMNGFKGRLDELVLYDHALTDAEIAALIAE